MDGFEEDAEPRRSRRKLMVIFSKVDVNTDRKISAKEMQHWIMEKLQSTSRRPSRRARCTSTLWTPMAMGMCHGTSIR